MYDIHVIYVCTVVDIFRIASYACCHREVYVSYMYVFLGLHMARQEEFVFFCREQLRLKAEVTSMPRKQ